MSLSIGWIRKEYFLVHLSAFLQLFSLIREVRKNSSITSMSPLSKRRSIVRLCFRSKQKSMKSPTCSVLIRLPQGTPLLWRGWGRSQYPILIRFPQGTPLLRRGWGRSQYLILIRFPRGTPLLRRGWGRSLHPLSLSFLPTLFSFYSEELEQS